MRTSQGTKTRILLLTAALALLLWPVRRVEAQNNQPFYFGLPPGGIGGGCTNPQPGYLTTLGQVVTCSGSLWTAISGGTGNFSPSPGATTGTALAGLGTGVYGFEAAPTFSAANLTSVPACATCIVASSPAVGILHVAGGTQTATSSAVNLATADVTGTLAVAHGGTGTTSPALVAGTNVTITGSWPNQTINSSGGGGSGCTPSGAAGVVQASNGSSACQATSITDNGTTVSTTEPIQGPSFTGTGSNPYINFPSNPTHTGAAGDLWNNAGVLEFGAGPVQLITSGGDINTSNQVTVTHLVSALPVNQGGTNATTAANALISLFPTATRAGDVIYCATYSSGCTSWALLAGNNSGTQYLSENASGVAAWASPSGSGTVNSGTAGHLGYYASSTTAISDMGADFTFATHTLSGGASAILDMHSAATTALLVPGGFTTGVLHNTTSTGALAGGLVVSADLNITTSSCTAPKIVTAISATAIATCTAPDIPQGSHSAAYTTVLADDGTQILHPAADNNARTFTIDSNANVAYPIGATLVFVNLVNTLTISITSDTLTLAGTASTGSRTCAVNCIATAVKIGTTSWLISGPGLT